VLDPPYPPLAQECLGWSRVHEDHQNHAVTHAIATANSIVSISAIALAASSVMRSPFVVTEGKHADPSEGQKQGNAVCPFLRCQRPWSASG
jgi:hypothetical protein